MKRNILLFFIATFLVGALACVTGVRCYADDDDGVPIIIGEGSLGGTPSHHAPAVIPIQAAYYPSITTILVDFLYDLGQVSVEIENETTGAYSQTTINAMQGVQPFIITGASGIYELTFTLANGIVYIGSFEIE